MRAMLLILPATLAAISLAVPVLAQSDSEAFPQLKTTAKGYAVYRQFQTFENVATLVPYWKKEVDLAAVEMKAEYYLSPKSEVELELEIEHGGTGAAMEYDGLDEFGEFETETEKGGEVVLSEFYYRHLFGNLAWFKVGKIPVFISLANTQESPLLQPTVDPVIGENSMLATEWRDVGVEVEKRLGGYGARASITNGLNSEFFRKYTWVGGGYQRQFEQVNAGDLAGNLSLEYGDVRFGDGVVGAVYYGNTTGNRYKRHKLDIDTQLVIASLFGAWHFGPVGVRGELIQGQLSNSDRISAANKTLSGGANPGNYANIGHKARLEMLELSYKYAVDDDLALTPFISYSHVDTMLEVEGSVLKDDRYDQTFTTAGLMTTWDTAMFLKAQYSRHATKLTGLPETDEFQLAFGFDLRGFTL